jgi:hypothetical protein
MSAFGSPMIVASRVAFNSTQAVRWLVLATTYPMTANTQAPLPTIEPEYMLE